MQKKHRYLGLCAALLAGASLLGGVALAASAAIEQAKDACVVGEKSDGYLGVVAGATASDELRREVRDVNQQRKTYYADLARENGVTVDVAAKLTAEKLIARSSRGQCVYVDGAWKKL